MENQDRIVKTTTEPRDMFITLPNGNKIPVKGKVIQSYWQSGRIDAHVEIEKPIDMHGQEHEPEGK